MPITTVVFDAYGTLFDVSAAARRAAADPGNEALADVLPMLSSDWRDKQLGYSWLRAAAGRHCDLWQVTEDALDWAMAANGLDDPALRKVLLALYRKLDAYPEAGATLATLKERGLATAILSNGSPGMLADAVTSAGLDAQLDAVLSVEAAGAFKPHPSVYDLVGARFGTRPGEVLFVSSNGWDAAAASGYGFRTVWVNRMGAPVDRLWAQPSDIVPDLSHIPGLC